MKVWDGVIGEVVAGRGGGKWFDLLCKGGIRESSQCFIMFGREIPHGTNYQNQCDEG